jgi:hypothetical protein
MAVKVTQTLLNNGNRNLNMVFVGQGDGQGQAVNQMIVNAAQFVPVDQRPLRVNKITSDVGYGIVTLAWDAAIPKPFAILGGTGQTFDYNSVGGMNTPLPSQLEGATGNIVLSTTGFEAGSTFTIKLDMVK